MLTRRSVPLPVPGRAARRGFTLIELLLVIAIIALLVSLLLPSLGTVRETARMVVCSNNLKQVATAHTSYSVEFKEAIAGAPLHSGFHWLPRSNAQSGYVKATNPQFNGIATQPWDFQGPLAAFTGQPGPGDGLSFEALNTGANPNEGVRGQRWAWLRELGMFECPSNQITAAPWGGSGVTLNNPNFPVARMNPYFMATTFTATEKAPSLFGTADRSQTDGIDRRGWVPNFVKAGSPSMKILTYEASRYSNHEVRSSSAVTYNFDGDATYGGNYGDVGAWFGESYGSNRRVAPGETGRPGLYAGLYRDSRVFAWRHGGTRAVSAEGLSVGSGSADSGGGERQLRGNFAYFDGHVETMGDLECTDPDKWFPTGTVFTRPLNTWTTTAAKWPAKTVTPSTSKPYNVP